jgi:5S rRNA maturation endonuclease (ribonuclease M5)
MNNIKENIINFLERNNIDYKLKGKNISKGNIGIICPYCNDDTGFHLGIREDGVFACWRDSEHQGNIINLIKKLLNCSYYEALAELNIVSIADSDSMIKAVNRLFKNTNNIQEIKKQLLLSNDFHNIENYGSTKKFYDYLIYRGFNKIEYLIKYYRLKCCLINKFSNRLIFPIYEKGKLITWVGRSVYKNDSLPYMTQPQVDSIKITTDCLYDYDNIIEGGKILFICEGVFDCMKINWYTSEEIKATCLFTKRMSTYQQSLLLTLIDKYDKIIILLDPDAEINSQQMYDEITWMSGNIEIGKIQKGFKDVGEMKEKDINILINKFIRRKNAKWYL